MFLSFLQYDTFLKVDYDEKAGNRLPNESVENKIGLPVDFFSLFFSLSLPLPFDFVVLAADDTSRAVATSSTPRTTTRRSHSHGGSRTIDNDSSQTTQQGISYGPEKTERGWGWWQCCRRGAHDPVQCSIDDQKNVQIILHWRRG